MSNVSTGSAGQTPPPVRFPDTKGEAAHRWGAGAIALVVGLVVVIAAVVVAVVVFSGGSDKIKPVPTLPSQIMTPAPTKVQPQATTHGSRLGVQSLDYHSTLATSDAPDVLAYGPGVVDLGDGLSLVPAKGWTVEDQDDHFAMLLNSDGTAELVVVSGRVETDDVMSVLRDDINYLSTGPDAILSNLKIGEPDQQPVQSKNFQQMAAVPYTADLSMQQGTMRVYGVFLELMNTKTQEAVFFDLHAVDSDTLEAAAADTDEMISSLL